ncbi:hypothetical protein ACFJGW_06785 [Burkholderiaceae bacterium UC74_6]
MSLFSTCKQALSKALQWRFLLLWTLALALPTLIVSLPLFIQLNQLLGRSLAGASLLEGADTGVLADAFGALMTAGWSPATGVGGLIVFAVMLPWLGGLLVAVTRAERPLPISELASAGLREYGRMLRLWIWAVVPLGVFGGIGSALMNWADSHGETVILSADADAAHYWAMAAVAVLLAFVSATLDAARARFATEPYRRSAFFAWWAGFRDVLRHPRWWLIYVLLTAFGLVLAAVFAWVRIQVAPIGVWSFLLDLLLAQAIVVALAWSRAARVVAFAKR